MKSNYNIPKNEISMDPMSVVDDIGILFTWNNHLFRAIKTKFVERVRCLFNCGMMDELFKENLFPNSWISEYKIEGYDMVIEHTKIKYLSYPYEWSFSMLKDAALTVLKVNKIASKYGFQTSDCHSFNVVFDGLKPKFVDLGSFVRIKRKSKVLFSYEQFLKSYYYPLKIWSKGNSFIARSIIANESEFISISEYFKYKYFTIRIMPISLVNKIIHLISKYNKLHFISYKSLRKKLPKFFVPFIWFLSKNNLIPFCFSKISTLISKVKKINPPKSSTRWGKYHNEFYADSGKLESSTRFESIIKKISEYNINSIVELGGNQGVFSKLLLESGSIDNAVCSDYDENAVDFMYISSKKRKTKSLTPVLLNCMFPITVSMDKSPWDRFKADAVIVLALTHHLILSKRLRINFILEKISKYSKKYVFIEFMPLGLWDGKKSAQIPQFYSVDWFRKSFQNHFNIIYEEKIEKNRILFIGELFNNSTDNK